LTYDYIVVGAGSAGSIVAARLSEDERLRVLVLEAGAWDRNPWIHVPLGVGKTIVNPAVNWCYRTQPQAELMNREIYMARGKVIGGSHAINGLLHVRGQREDYDGWASAGAEGWGWADVLPFFRKSEDHYLGDSELHSTGGPVTVSRPEEPSVLCEAFIQAAVNYGLERNEDFSSGQQDGAGRYDLTVRHGMRSNSAKGALHPAKHRTNLKVQVRAHVERIVFEGRRAVGVVVLGSDGQRKTVRASREIVLCSGAINTPQLLMLSGVGPKAELDRLGIPTVADRGQVGSNLQDHVTVRVICKTHEPITLNDDLSNPWRRLRIGAKFLFRRRGPLTFAGGQAGMFFRSDEGLPRVDAQAFLMPLSVPAVGQMPHQFSAFSVSVMQSWPTSRGLIRLRDAQSTSPPIIDPQYLSTAADRDFFVRAVPKLRAVLATRPMDAIVSSEFQPGEVVRSREDLLAFVRHKAATISHPCGSCRMGGDRDSVVDPQLRVREVEGLRIADASVFPTITSGNINATCLMIGEKAADLILRGGPTPRP
jgi:choline dehydrogenase-like flavoprotein